MYESKCKNDYKINNKYIDTKDGDYIQFKIYNAYNNMYQYRSNQTQRSARTKQKSVQSESLKQKQPRSRFPEARLLVLTVRHISNHKIKSVFNLIKVQIKPRYQYLNVVDVMCRSRVQWAFMEIRITGAKGRGLHVKQQAERVNRGLFLSRFMQKLWSKAVRDGMSKIQHYNSKNNVNQLKIQQSFAHIEKILTKNIMRIFLRKIIKISEYRKLNKSKSFQLIQNCNKISIKNIKLAFSKIFCTSSTNKYEQMFKQSQQLRKNFYDFQNNKRIFMEKQRQNLHNLKQTIDNYAYQKNVKAGQMKRQKAIKISQTQQQIKKLQKDYEAVEGQCRQLEKIVGKMAMILNKRQNLTIRSTGALIKVHHIYNTLKYEMEPISSPKSSSLLLKIVLNKQKFSQALSQFNLTRSKIQQFQLVTNITNRNLICLYQNIPMQSVKHSQEYLKIQYENSVLKSTINSLLSYHLLKDQGDSLLKINNNQLETVFQQYFQYVHAQQQQNMNKQDEFSNNYNSNGQQMIKLLSYTAVNTKNSNNRKRRSSFKISTISNKSIK